MVEIGEGSFTLALLKFTGYMNPLVKALKELGGSAFPDEVCERIARKLSLPDESLDEHISSGASRFENRVHWARLYLAKAGYIDSSKRGVWGLTEKGQSVKEFTNSEIQQIVQEVREKAADKEPVLPEAEGNLKPVPVELEPIGGDYKEKLLLVLKSLPAPGFERLCQKLLRESGFEKVNVTGRSGDGGIDGTGVLQVNPFVSFQVLFQCKRYDGSVSASQVRDFRGAMMGRAEKGIIITTGSFTMEAKREASRDGVPQIELVDGEKLIDMFEKLELGLVPRSTFDIDYDFFETFRSSPL